ncbi:MAG: Ig-like domain-containing protein [Candidatus Bipolaricaulota bacterium]|nr:Ig-like domain-containing protein [Candidatus Bipolaricaulota bacterium]
MITLNRQTVCFILLTAVVLLSTIGLSGAAQDKTLVPGAGPVAPTVVRIVPERGEELRVDAAIVLSFSAEMDRASTEDAVRLSPEAPLRFEWPDGRTLRVLPVTAWLRDVEYALTITTSARDLAGVPFAELAAFRVRTVGYLKVTQTAPADESTEIATTSTVVLTFNRPVIALTALSDPRSAELPKPLRFIPEVQGAGEWLNTSIYVFTPERPLRGGTQYTATVPAGLTDATGGLLATDASWTFTTERPKVAWTAPDSGESLVSINTMVRIAFNMSVDRAAAADRFSLRKVGLLGITLSPKVDGTMSTEGNDVLFTPKTPLDYDTEYLATLESGVTGIEGGLGAEAFTTWRFRTVPLPRVVGTSPKDGDDNVYPYASFQIEFNTPIDPDTVMNHVTVEPAPAPADVSWYYRSWDNTYVLDFGAAPSRTYTVRVSPGISDPYGNKTAEHLTVKFKTAALEPAAWFQVPDRVATYSTYEPARLYVGHRNTDELRLTLTRIDTAAYFQAMSDWYNFAPPAEGKLRSWTVPVTSTLNDVAYAPVDLVKGGGALEPGVYVVDVRASGVEWDRWQHRRILIASPTHLTLKTSSEETLVLATDLETGTPVGGLILWALDGDGKAVDVDVTDSHGLAQFPTAGPYDWRGLTVMARSPFVLASSEWSDGVSPWDFDFSSESSPKTRTYIDTDRPIYRADQTVFFRAVLRGESDVHYAIPRPGKASVTIQNPSWDVVYEEDLAIDEFGTVSDQLALAKDAPLGTYSLRVDWEEESAYATFEVAAYRAPEFEVTVEVDPNQTAHGNPIAGTARATYFFGAPVADVPVEWRVISAPYSFSPPQLERYTFADNDDPWNCFGCWWRAPSPVVPILEGTGRTDASGALAIALPPDIASRRNDPEDPPVTDSRTLTLEATAHGRDGQAISGRASVVVHQGSYYVGLAAAKTIARTGEEMPVDVVTVDWAGARLPTQSLSYTVYRREWSSVFESNKAGGGQWTWTSSDIEVARGALTTDEAGEGRVAFVPEQGGTYKVAVQGLDERERRIRAGLFVWASGLESVSWRRENDDRIALVSDKTTYSVGDTAKILVPSPYPGAQWAWVTVERGGILSQQVVELPSNSTVLEIPITEDAVPNVYIGVVLFQGRAAAVAAGAPPTAGWKVGYAAVSVNPAPRILSIALEPSSAAPRPGDVLDVALRVTDADGQPVRGSFSLDVVDKAVLSLQPRTPNRIASEFFGVRGLGVRTAGGLTISLGRLVLEQQADVGPVAAEGAGKRFSVGSAAPMAAMAEAGGSDQEQARSASEQLPSGLALREDFADTAFWAPAVKTDTDGRAAVQVKLPDNLTTWVVRAVGVTTQTEVGEATVDILVTKPLLIRPVVPRFFVVGDRVRLAASVTNQTPDDLAVEVTMGSTGLTLEDPAVRTVDVAAHGEATVTWWVTVNDVAFVDLAWSAVSGELSDAARPRLTTGPEGTVPVYRYTAPEIVGTAGVLAEAGGRTETIALPPEFDASRSRLDLRLDFSLAASMRDGLSYLEHFEYECTEQVVSRFLPNVLTFRALRLLHLDDPELAAKLDDLVLEGLEKLYTRQNNDGGWGWWEDEESSSHLTAYATYALLRLGDADVAVHRDVIDRALGFLKDALVPAKELDAGWEANRQAWILYVLSLGSPSESVKAYADDLFAGRTKLSHYAKAYLAMTLDTAAHGSAEVRTLLSDLTNDAILSATGAHWEEPDYDGWAMNTDTRSTAVILDAFAKLDPENSLVPNVVRWLMVARKDGIWETTQENAWALIALTDWMVVSRELSANYEYEVLWDHEVCLEGAVTPANVGTPVRQSIPGTELGSGDLHPLTFFRGDGEGKLYYTAHLYVQLPADQVGPLDRGILVDRRYVAADCAADATCPDVVEAAVGETFEVRLTLIAPHDLYYVVLEDPIPAGCEAINTALATESVESLDPSLSRESGRSPWYFWWWWRWYSRSEIRDEKVVLFADYLPAGTYSYVYQVRAVQPGEYKVLPASAHEFYFPEVFGRSAGRAFTVVPSE